MAFQYPPPPPPPLPGPAPTGAEESLPPHYTVAMRNLDVPQGDPLPPCIFRLGADLMRLIIDFMYFGQLDMLEEQAGPFSDEQYDVITRLLAWYGARSCSSYSAVP